MPVTRPSYAALRSEIERERQRGLAIRQDVEEALTRRADEARSLRSENERLRAALRIVASNMRALEDGGCDFPRVTASFSVAMSALSGGEVQS